MFASVQEIRLVSLPSLSRYVCDEAGKHNPFCTTSAGRTTEMHGRVPLNVFFRSSEREGSVHAAERAIFEVRIKQRQPHPH